MPTDTLALDSIDRQILELLQNEGRLANQDLADLVGLSPSPCLRRVRALEKGGFITDYRAMVDAKKLGFTLTVLVRISLDRHTPDRFTNFEKKIRSFPEVLECLLVTGENADYVLKAIVRDMESYRDLLLNRITRIEGVTGVRSSFVLRSALGRTAVPTAP